MPVQYVVACRGQLTNDFDSLSLLSILDISGSGLQHDVEHPNDAGDFLPDWLHLNRLLQGPISLELVHT